MKYKIIRWCIRYLSAWFTIISNIILILTFCMYEPNFNEVFRYKAMRYLFDIKDKMVKRHDIFEIAFENEKRDI